MINNARKYAEAMWEKPLPEMSEDERIYFKVPYMMRGYAKRTGCAFDDERKLWYTGAYNSHLRRLSHMYDLDEEHTSDKAKMLFDTAIKVKNDDDRQKLYDLILQLHEE